MKKNFHYIRTLLCKKKALGISIIFLIAFNSFLSIEIRVFAGNLIDSLTEGAIYHNVLLLVVSVILILLAIGYIKDYLENRYLASLKVDIYSAIISHTCMQLDIGENEIGQINTYMTRDVDAISKCVIRFFKVIVPDLTIFVLAMITIAQNSHWMFSLSTILFCSVQIAITGMVNGYMKPLRNRFQQELDKSNETAARGIDNLEAIKSHRIEKSVSESYLKSFDEYKKLNRDITLKSTLISAQSILFTFTIIFILTVVSGALVNEGKISIGSFFIILSMIDNVINPIMRFNNSIEILYSTKTNTERLNHYFSLPEWKELPKAIHTNTKEIEFEHVSFSYYPTQKVLDNISFLCSPGTRNIILGRNGCGKSTIIKVLLGILPLQKGDIHVMGMELDELDSMVLCNNIAVMTQDDVILPVTIYENLALGNQAISEGEVYKICKLIGLHDEIQQFPEKYETILQDNGDPLSGGQKKRIAIARTLLRNVPIYIFDEPSVSLDDANIAILNEILTSLSKERTVVVISHDMRLIKNESNIIVLDGD